MDFVEVRESGCPWTLLLPAERATDEVWRRSAVGLAQASAVAYNASLEALGTGDYARALRLADDAVKLMPYAAAAVELAARLHAQHGDLVRAHTLAAHAERLGLLWANDVQTATQEGVARYNAAIGGKPVEEIPGSTFTSFRESRLTPRSSTPATEPRAKGRLFTRTGVVGAVAGVVLLLGGIALGRTLVPAPAVLVPVASPTMTADYGPALAALARGDVQALFEQTRTDSTAAAVALRGFAAERLLDDTRPYWRQGSMDSVATHLAPLLQANVSVPPEGLYYLGVASYSQGDTASARIALTRFLEAPEAGRWPHYRAQAAFYAALLAPPAEATGYARIITDDFPETLYNTARIRSLARP